MSRFLHTLSAILFYILGTGFFVAIVLNHNGVAGNAPRILMDIIDLPLLLTGLLYGGISLYRSIRNDAEPSHALMIGLALPLAILFGILLITNFLTPSL